MKDSRGALADGTAALCALARGSLGFEFDAGSGWRDDVASGSTQSSAESVFEAGISSRSLCGRGVPGASSAGDLEPCLDTGDCVAEPDLSINEFFKEPEGGRVSWRLDSALSE